MPAQQQLDAELARLRAALERAGAPDPIDVAVVEALASQEVQELLSPLLDAGAFLRGCVLDSAGTVAGVVLLTFETEWIPGTSHLSPAPSVSAYVEISPPRVLKAGISEAPTEAPTPPFAAPTGPVPPAIRDVGVPSASEAHAFNLEANRSFQTWAEQQGLAGAFPAIPIKGLTTGTKCTSFFCFERTRDDFD